MGRVGQADRVRRLFPEAVDLDRVLRVHLDDTELIGIRDGLADRRDRDAGTGLPVLVDHLAKVHAIDVVGAQDSNNVRPLVIDGVEGLINRVGAAEVPVLAAALLRRNGGDVVAQLR